MIKFNLKHALAVITAMSVLFCVASFHGEFWLVVLCLAPAIAIAATIVTHFGLRLNQMLGCSLVILATGAGILIAHSLMGGNVTQQPGRLFSAIVVGFTFWLLTLYLYRPNV